MLSGADIPGKAVQSGARGVTILTRIYIKQPSPLYSIYNFFLTVLCVH